MKKMDAKPSENEVFEFSGPLQLTSCVDWKLPEHKRSIMASLIKGVYIAEKDNLEKRVGENKLAPNWWEAFHFKCIKFLWDEVDSSIFGAIFEATTLQNASPKYVIAFRGTMIEQKTINQDCYFDVQIILNKLNHSSRCEIARDEVARKIGNTNPANVWLAGHSLGASIALQTGRDMAIKGYHLETYLFNPPFLRLPLEKVLKRQKIKDGARFINSFVKAGVSLARKKTREYDPFILLNSWIPYLFVNPQDMICCEYIGYFEHREKMERQGLGVIERMATKISVMCMALDALSGRDGDASHLIPSASVTKNMNNMIVKEHDLSVAHGLCQWWEQHSCWKSKPYRYSSCSNFLRGNESKCNLE